ncbi:MAG: peroxide stress protein YaaA [Robiginitomaculum sp.]|nr:peroxide stress protein YaaA [Robiginitomaculum sp.]
MLTLLSPAKKLVTPAFDPNLSVTAPVLGKSAQELSVVTKKLTRAQIRQMMKLSENLTELTFERFQDLNVADKTKGTPAVLTFAGDVYRGLQVDTLLPQDLDFAQNSLRILSGLYGVLRPLDIIQPYRLEMGRKITTSHGEDLYDFWGSSIADELNQQLQSHDHQVIINLASNEYFKAVDKKALNRTIISPVFKEEKDGQQRILSVFAKLARGLMARWIVQNRITDPADLKNFDIAGYSFCTEGSTLDKPLFVRPQPQKKAA